MRTPQIYTPQPLQSGCELALEGSAAHYLGRVLRMQPGRELILFNGEGGEYRASIREAGKKSVTVAVSEFVEVERESPLSVHLGIGVSRGERFDWVLQKATELGVTAITPLFTERTEVRLSGPRLEKKTQHWQQVLVSACEQCQRNHLPQLQPAVALSEWLTSVDCEQRFVLHHRSDRSLVGSPPPASVALLIGPEGGLNDGEIASASGQFGFRSLTLGPRVLRTETAPIAALSLLQFLWGDLS